MHREDGFFSECKDLFTFESDLLMRPTYRLVSDFIIPSLENETFGKHLQWENRKIGSFKISRIHQSSEMWNEECIEVYKAWSTKKKLWNTSDPKRITRAKHRLITALRRNPDIETLLKENTSYRFRIVNLRASDCKSNYAAPSEEIEACSTTKENQEFGNILISEGIENQEIKNDLSIFKEQQIFSLFNNQDINVNSSSKPLYQSECYMQRTNPIADIFDAFNGDEGKSVEFRNNGCCCEVMEDYELPNPNCIWHGST